MATDRTIYKFEGDATGLIKSSKDASKALDGTSKSAVKTTKAEKDLGVQSKSTSESMAGLTRGAGLLAVGLLAAGAAAGKLLQTMADSQNELGDLSARTGVATKTLAGLRLAAKGSGQDFKAVSSALKPLVLRLGQAAQGSKTAMDGFKSVGVEVLDAEGKLRSADDVLMDISSNLVGMEDPTERAAAAALAFGSAGTKLVQALGGQELQHFVDAAEQFGMDTGPRAAAAADEWQRSMANLDLVMRPFTTELMEAANVGVKRFSLGWIYLSTLLDELSKDILPNLGNIFKVLFADLSLWAIGFAETITGTLMGALLGFAKAWAMVTGNTDIQDRILGLIEGQNKAAASMKNYWIETKIAVGNTTSLGNAYKKALEKAKAFHEFQNTATTKKTGGGGLGGIGDTGAGAGGGGLEFGDAGPIIEEGDGLDIEFGDAEIQVRTIKDDLADSSLIIGDMVGQMTNLTDPTGIFRDILTDVAGTMEVLANTDFKNVESGLAAASSVAKTMGNVLGTLLKEQLKGDEELTKKKRKNLMRLFTAQKLFAIASIAMDTAGAIMRAFNDLGPIAGAVAAALIGGIGIAQAVVVANQKPPFHTGGIIPAAPGKQGVEINALPGESVLTREATAGLGAEGVASLNSGGGGQPMVIEMVYKHRIFDTFVQDNISKGGPLRDAIDSGKRVGHRG